jgi:tRNA(Leu) C34 or U34 (ribose-2'-O)-methylase TrmL
MTKVGTALRRPDSPSRTGVAARCAYRFQSGVFFECPASFFRDRDFQERAEIDHIECSSEQLTKLAGLVRVACGDEELGHV